MWCNILVHLQLALAAAVNSCHCLPSDEATTAETILLTAERTKLWGCNNQHTIICHARSDWHVGWHIKQLQEIALDSLVPVVDSFCFSKRIIGVEFWFMDFLRHWTSNWNEETTAPQEVEAMVKHTSSLGHLGHICQSRALTIALSQWNVLDANKLDWQWTFEYSYKRVVLSVLWVCRVVALALVAPLYGLWSPMGIVWLRYIFTCIQFHVTYYCKVYSPSPTLWGI